MADDPKDKLRALAERQAAELIEEARKHVRLPDVIPSYFELFRRLRSPEDIALGRLLERARAAKAAKRVTPEAMAATDGLERMVDAACILSGRKPAKTDKCVQQIRDHLPEEARHATDRQLKKALGSAKERRATKKN
jgi:hypothetical protein